jgi:hypothetical protein
MMASKLAITQPKRCFYSETDDFQEAFKAAREPKPWGSGSPFEA